MLLWLEVVVLVVVVGVVVAAAVFHGPWLKVASDHLLNKLATSLEAGASI